jgi:hypothetical protein
MGVMEEQDLFPQSENRSDAESDARPQRRGRARERVQRRKQTRATGELFAAPVSGDADSPGSPMGASRFAAPPRRSSPSQVKPAGGLTLPNVNLPINRTILVAVGSVLFIVIVVVALGSLRNRPVEDGVNALWLGDEWTYTPADESAVNSLVERMRTNRVDTLFAWITQLMPDRAWFGEENFEAAGQFAATFKAAYPNASLYGWIRIPVDGVSITLDSAAQSQIAAVSQRIVDEMGFDGVLLHVDPILSEDEAYLALLRQVRTSIGSASLAAAVPPDWTPVAADVPQPPLIAPGTIWDTTYKQRVALLVDEIVVQTYNTGFDNPIDYTRWIAYQVESYTAAIAALDVAVNLFVGIPTYDADPPRFNPAVENIASAAAGLRDGVSAAGEAARFLRGAALYAEWTTDDREWEAFRSEWAVR